MKLKGYYLHYDARTIIGVSKKMDMQIRELSKIADIQEICVPLKTKNVIINALAVLPLMSLAWDYSAAYKNIQNADFVYIRSVGYDYKAYRLLRWIKINNPNCIILSEIPTYSKKERIASVQGMVLYPKELFYRKRISALVDRYVTYSKDDYIYNTKTISIHNGIEVDSIRQIEGKLRPDCIRLIAVAMMQPAHGYERLIEGLNIYYSSGGERRIIVHLVGEGPESRYYQKLVKKYGLDEYIIFHGQKYGSELDAIYNEADIALGGLAPYKFELELSSSLKTREYLAKGLPIIYTIPIDILEGEEFLYKLQFSNDASALDITRIVSFYDDIFGKNSREYVSDIVRAFAKRKVEFCESFKPVVDFAKLKRN